MELFTLNILDKNLICMEKAPKEWQQLISNAAKKLRYLWNRYHYYGVLGLFYGAKQTLILCYN